MSAEIVIRFAEMADASVIAEFNSAMALETENKKLFPEVVFAGVQGLLGNPSLGFYVIAERGGDAIGSLMVTTEWSDWRNGLFWWIQSVYVRPACRRQRVYTRLYRFVRDAAQKDPRICGFRLYVEKDNIAAQNTYRTLGMAETDYRLFEELKGDVRFCESASE